METMRCLNMLLLVTCALEVLGVLSRDPHQDKKADVVKKFLKKHKKREGELRLVDGSGDHEGKLDEPSIITTSIILMEDDKQSQEILFWFSL